MMGYRSTICPWCGFWVDYHPDGSYHCGRGYDTNTRETCSYSSQTSDKRPVERSSAEATKIKKDYEKKCKNIKTQRDKDDPDVQLKQAEKRCVKAAIGLLKGRKGSQRAAKDAAEEVLRWRAIKAVRQRPVKA